MIKKNECNFATSEGVDSSCSISIMWHICQTAEGKHLTGSDVGTEPDLLWLQARIKAARYFYPVCCHLLISSKSTLFPELRGNSLCHRAGDLYLSIPPRGEQREEDRSHGLTSSHVHPPHTHTHASVCSFNKFFLWDSHEFTSATWGNWLNYHIKRVNSTF